MLGPDTLAVQPHPWVQGGNSFGTTGIIGTKDNNHMDFYSNNIPRGRLTNTGHWLLGTTADNGNIFQVNGTSSFNDSVHIGSATITNAGRLIGTNAWLHEDFVSQYPTFQGHTLYISQLGNIFYNYATRFNTTTTTEPDGSQVIDIVIPDHELISGSLEGITYTVGNMYFSFWQGTSPQSITVYMKTRGGTWYGPYSSSTNLNPPNGFFQIPIPNVNAVYEYRITFTAAPGIPINLQNVEYVLAGTGEGLINPFPFVGKYGSERLYNFLSFKNAGQDNVRLSPYLTSPSFFLNNIGIGTTDPTAQLHTTGSVRFAGLTNDPTKTRVLVSDANGNLYYRNLSAWSSNGTVNSDLAVKGTLSAQQLKLMPAVWADYVFDKSYHLPSLPEVENYIRQNNHLPGIPSAIEVKEKGIEVGESQAALLKKIEELTLYVIEQEKNARKQAEEINALKEQNKELASLKQQMAELTKLISK